jgi:hypothetical protein
VRDPRGHEIEHVAVDAELVVEGADGGDGGLVDVGDQPVGLVEDRVGQAVGAVEEPGGEALVVVVQERVARSMP